MNAMTTMMELFTRLNWQHMHERPLALVLTPERSPEQKKPPANERCSTTQLAESFAVKQYVCCNAALLHVDFETVIESAAVKSGCSVQVGEKGHYWSPEWDNLSIS